MGWDLNVKSDATHGIYGHLIVSRFLITGNVKSVDGDLDRDSTSGGGLGTMVDRNLYGAAKGKYKVDGFLSITQERQLASIKRRQSPFYTCAAPKGLFPGAPADVFPGSFGNYSKTFANDKEAGIKTEIGAQGEFDEGTMLIAPDSLLSGASGVSIEDNNTAFDGATNYGGILAVWLAGVTGGTGVTVTFKVTHATTLGGTYADVAGGSTGALSMGTEASEVKQARIPAPTAINAFTQIAWAAIGVPTNFQAMAVWARRYNPAL